MNAPEKIMTVNELMASWGFEGCSSDQLIMHAANCVKFSSSLTGEILVGLGIATKEQVERYLESKPQHIKTLDWMRTQDVKGVAGRIDEIMAIQHKRAFISKDFKDLQIHRILTESKNKEAILKESTDHGLIPVHFWGKTILLFADIEKLFTFNSLDRARKAGSLLIRELKSHNNDSDVFNLCLASDLVLMTYRNMVGGASGADDDQDSLQTIMQNDGDGNAVMENVISILNQALAEDVNDVWIKPDRDTNSSHVYFRKFQRLTKTKVELKGGERDEFIRVLISRSRSNLAGGKLQHPVDGNANFVGKNGSAFLRFSFIPLESSQGESISVSIRVLPREAKYIEMEKLNISPAIVKELNYFVRRKLGLFVVCGPTGSGKSTTIASMLCEHHKLHGDSLKRLSVEQPCERMLPGVQSIDVSQHRYTGVNANQDNFSEALKRILRHDPDVIFIGEVRDKESCATSIDAANTGHLVFTTTHANEPVLGYRRLASMLPQERHFDLVNVIEGILVQRLITTVCDVCSTEHPFDDAIQDELNRYAVNKGINLSDFTMPESIRVANKHGCDKCIEGYGGMVPVHGLLTMNPRVRECLLSKNEQDWMRAQSESGSKHSLFDSAFEFFKSGQIDLDTLML